MIKLVGGAVETSNANTEIVLSLQDATGALDDFLDSHHSTELMRVMCPPAALYTRRGSNLAFPNYAPLPSPRINQFVIPTGASRWGYGLFLATEQQKDTIYQCQRSRGNMTLYIGAPMIGEGASESASESVRTIKLPVHCLPPHPITPRGRLKQDWSVSANGVSRRIEGTVSGYPTASDLYLIPIVDVRYFWQYLHTGAMSEQDFSSDAGPFTACFDAGDETSGEKIWNYLANRLPDSLVGDGSQNIVAIDDLHPYYQTPPKFVTENDYENLAVIMDSYLWMHGLQLVVNLTNDYHIANESPPRAYEPPYTVVSVQESQYIYNGYLTGNHGNVNGKIGLGVVSRNTGSGARTVTAWGGGGLSALTPVLIAGGDNYRFTTGSTTILEGKPFPAKLWVALGDGTYSEESIPAEFSTHGSYTSLAKSVSQTAAVCRYQWSESISNDQLDQIVYDWYMRYYRQFDMTFAGIQLWQQSCFDDYMVVSMARCHGRYQCQTRVVSICLNHQADVCGDTDDRMRGVIAADFSVPSSCLAAMTTFTFYHLSLQGDGTSEVVEPLLTGYCDDPEIEGSPRKGTLCRVEKLNGRWMLYYLACSPDPAAVAAIDAL